MKVLQIPFHYFPNPVGGTEVYVSSLAKRLQERGVHVTIAAPADTNDEYVHDHVPVRRFAVTKSPADLAVLYGKGDPQATREVVRILDRCQPDLVHLHAMSPAVSFDVVNEIRKRDIPAVFTCHIPGILCPRGTLLRNGTDVCDGVWELTKCTTCTIQAQGVPTALATAIAAVPSGFGERLADYGMLGGAITAFRMQHLQAGAHDSLVRFLDGVHRIVAVSQWLRDMLVANGVNGEKVVVCRHGASQGRASTPVPSSSGSTDGVLRLAFLGRLNAAKGVDVLVEAMRRRPGLAIRLDIFGIDQGGGAYVEQLQAAIRRDGRIRLFDPLKNDEVVTRLRAYDALAVPSQWMETGPLVVYDAFMAGIPVVGSRRGGILELVRDEQDGLLVEAGDPDAWADALGRLASDDSLGRRLRASVRRPRSMSAVASEMLELYAEALSRSESCASS